MTISGQDSLTDLRELIWSALENYSPLDLSGWSKFKEDGTDPYFDHDSQTPEMTSLPAIGVWPSTLSSAQWFENTNQLVKVRFEIVIWTPGYELSSAQSKPERWIWLIREALWRAGSGGSTDSAASYIKLGTCFYPTVLGGSYRKIKFGNDKSRAATRSSLTVELTIKDDPRTP